MRNVAESTGWSRADRYAISVSFDYYEHVPTEAGAWYESEAEIRAGLAEGRKKEMLLGWVRTHMADLSTKQQQYIMLYYFEGLTYQEIARRMNVATSTACRTVLRGIDRLRKAAGLPPADQSKRPGRKYRNPPDSVPEPGTGTPFNPLFGKDSAGYPKSVTGTKDEKI